MTIHKSKQIFSISPVSTVTLNDAMVDSEGVPPSVTTIPSSYCCLLVKLSWDGEATVTEPSSFIEKWSLSVKKGSKY